MRHLLVALGLLAASFANGCDQPANQDVDRIDDRRGADVEVNAPGVDVKVDPESGVEVDAPGVHVDTKPDD